MGKLDRETDAFVGNVIRYLDSPSNYREYLPHHSGTTSVQDSALVMLDDIPSFVRTWLWGITLFTIVVGIVLLVALQN